MRKAAAAVLVLALPALAWYGRVGAEPGAFESSPYLARSHSHNDYAQPRPLFDALERGFASVEVDVFLVDGKLLVAHDLDEVSPSLTLGGLYLDPMRDIVQRNGGSVYAGSDRSLQLLIDVKSEANATYRVLHETLDAYSDVLTRWTDDGPRPGAVTAVLSGNRAVGLAATLTPRYVAIDGRVLEDRSTSTMDFMPLVSMDWEELGLSLAERQGRARAVIERLHAEGRKVRFWNTPEREDLWRSLLEMGVDYVGTDRVGRLDRALRALGEPTSP